MQLLPFTAMFFIAGCSCGWMYEENHSTRSTDARAVRRPSGLKASGSPACDIKRASDHSKFSAHLRLLLDNRGPVFAYSHLWSDPTHAVRESDTNPHEQKEVDGEMAATMETTGGHNTFRHKRGTKEHKQKALKNMSVKRSVPLTDALTLWDPMPRPLALTATDLPTEPTRQVDDPWDATPMTPPYAESEEKELFPNPFYPVSRETPGAYALTVVSGLIFAVGVTGNIVMMCVVCHSYYMRSISNALLANLAVWDLAVLVFCLPLVVFHELTKTWLLGQFSCKVVPYIEVASLGVVTFTLCALCIDRFRAATNVQMYYEMMENCRSTAAKLAVIWMGALLLALPELLIRQLVSENGGTGVAVEDGASERCLIRISTSLPDTLYVLGLTYEGARLWWCFGCYFCLPTLFTIGSSVATARRIRRAERGCARGNKKQIQLESQMNRTVVALAIAYGVCVVPENICNMISVYVAAGVPQSTMSLLHLLSQLLLFLRAAATPVLLLCLCRPFGRMFLECCCCAGACGFAARSSATGSDDNEHECTTELELSPFSTIRREMSNYTETASHC